MKTSEFISKLNDPAIVKKMSEAESPWDAHEIAKTAGVTDSFEEFVAEMEKFRAAVGELTEDDLAAVAGGTGEVEILTAVGTAAISAASVLATAATATMAATMASAVSAGGVFVAASAAI